MNKQKEQKFEKVVKWGNFPEFVFLIFLILSLSFIFCTIFFMGLKIHGFSEIVPLYEGLSSMLLLLIILGCLAKLFFSFKREVYWREIKE
jgi:hypothetical protein